MSSSKTFWLHPLTLTEREVLSIDAFTAPTDVGWKDTVRVGSREMVSIIARFTPYRGKYIYHCHMLEHEDLGMMDNFEVI